MLVQKTKKIYLNEDLQNNKSNLYLENKIKLDKIYNESCLETLKRIPNNFVDAVITSPPYNMNLRIRKGEYCSRQIVKELSTKYDGFADNIPIKEYNAFHTEVLKELLRVSNLVFYNVQIVTGSKRSIFKMIGDFNEKLKDIIVWDKKHAEPAIQSQVLNRRTELILVFENDYPISRQFRSAVFKRGTLSDIWQIGKNRKRKKNTDKTHGAAFPEELVTTIINNFTKDKDVIYDPFLGTGTTAVVAKKLNRRFIGSEILKDYYKIAHKRIREVGDLI
jgi:site-specific DNA-methyltransferase (adenine-specific)/modification methylase